MNTMYIICSGTKGGWPECGLPLNPAVYKYLRIQMVYLIQNMEKQLIVL